MQELIERLEREMGPDREIDGLIFEAVGGPDWESAVRFAGMPCGAPMDTCIRGAKDRAPHYTSSVDAAATLVPPGLNWRVGFGRRVPHNAEVWTSGNHGFHIGECDSTRAIALCIAALKVRSAMLAKDHG